MERIEKVFWLSDDILGYMVTKAFSNERIFIFYSVSQKKEIYKKIEPYTKGVPSAYNFLSTTRVLLNNNKTIWYGSKYKDDGSDIYFQFYLYDLLPFDGTKQ
jgi:hypothetical protein